MTQLFLNLEGIEGDSLVKNHNDEIEILSWSWGLDGDGASPIPGTRRRSRVVAEDLVIEKRIDAASPALFNAVATGKVIPKATLVAERDGGPSSQFLFIEMEDVTVDEIGNAGDDGDQLEQIALRFRTILYRYTRFDATGKRVGDDEFSYSFDIGAVGRR